MPLIKRRRSTRRPLIVKKKSRPFRLVFGKYRRRRLARAASTEYASCKESISVTATAGVMNYYRNFQLSDLALTRSQAIAKEYQYFKITKIEMVVQTLYDTFAPSFPGGAQMPQIFWMIDKGANLPAGLSFNDIQQLGAKPRNLNENNRRYAFAPAVGTVDETATGGTAGAQYRISPWLDTAGGSVVGLSQVAHQGCVWGITKMNPTDATQYNVQITYHFKFKKPQLIGQVGGNQEVAYYGQPASTTQQAT